MKEPKKVEPIAEVAEEVRTEVTAQVKKDKMTLDDLISELSAIRDSNAKAGGQQVSVKITVDSISTYGVVSSVDSKIGVTLLTSGTFLQTK